MYVSMFCIFENTLSCTFAFSRMKFRLALNLINRNNVVEVSRTYGNEDEQRYKGD